MTHDLTHFSLDNGLLIDGCLSPATYNHLLKFLDPVPLKLGDVLYRRDTPIRHVYFPQQGVLSLLVPMKNGQQVEVGTVGNEGMVGIGVLLDAAQFHLDTICQVPGSGLRMTAPRFKQELKRNQEFHRLMNRYSQALMVQFTQGIACNRLHSVEQRCARWLLATRDRVDSNTFPLTQEFLGRMLGVRRASVTTVAGKLHKEKLINYHRGVIQILNRRRLEKKACECYQVTKSETERLTH